MIFPITPQQRNGLEDARFVRFVEDDGAITYYATYTAYSGQEVAPELLSTDEFLSDSDSCRWAAIRSATRAWLYSHAASAAALPCWRG